MIHSTNNLLYFPILNPSRSFPYHKPLPNSCHRPLRFHCRRYSEEPDWDSNAESFRFRFQDDKFGRKSGRKWWSDDFYDDNNDFDDMFDDEEEEEDFWDKNWIFKVFKSYGYMLPAIIVSMLLGTGPQAFLMALALPLGQSAISLAINKLWGSASEAAPRRSRPRNSRQPFPERSATNFRNGEEEESGNGYTDRGSDRSWDSAYSSKKSKRSKFGGWDELNYQEESMRREPDIKFQRENNESKLSSRRRYRDRPLLLRLLIAVFPFLGSWTRIL